MTAHAAPRPRSSHEHSIRRLAVTDRQVAEAIALVDRNGLDYTEALECLVLEMAAELSRPVSGVRLPDRDDDDHCLSCMRVECPGCGGAA